MNDYRPVVADEVLEDHLRSLVRLSIAEDLDAAVDWTTVCLIDETLRGGCQLVPRSAGICAGLVTLPWIVDEFNADLQVELLTRDGEKLVAGQPMARLVGNVRDLLTSERTILNLLSRLCGVASLTHLYAQQIAGSPTRLYDTRKTTPGWRRLEKYAVGCGGGHNHRTGLYDGFLIKDNHLALAGGRNPLSPRVAAERAMQWRSSRCDHLLAPEIVEVEVDSLQQLAEVLPVGPDIVLVDNFAIEQIREAVRLRDQVNPAVELEASGNVTIDTIADIAATGIERVSCGALTHQATWLDLGLDWFDTTAS